MPADTLRQTRLPTEKSKKDPESTLLSTASVPSSRSRWNVVASISVPDPVSNPMLTLR